MSITSLSTNQAALVAQLNISNANTNVTNDVTQLSSGSRIVSAATDVAALSTGTALQSQVNVLNAAQSVASQGSSLLQVADGGLAQIQTILQRQQSIATSAQSGTLSDTQRGFLDQEFQSLTSQINQLASSTNFNGVNLLDGSLSQSLNSNTSTTASTQASASYTISTNAVATDTIKINGATFTFGTASGDITVGSDINSTTANLASFINNAASNTGLSTTQKTALSAISASQVGTSGTLSLTARSGGSLGGAVTIGAAIGTITVSATGANVGTTQAINNIAVASTSTALTSATKGGFVYGGQILYSGTTGSSTALVDSTGNAISITNTTTLQSLAAQINSGTSKSGVSAYITGASGNYSLNLSSSNSSGGTAVTAANSSALALGTTSALTTSGSAATTLGSSAGPLLASAAASTQQSFTFNGLTSASTVLTEGNSGLANGQLTVNKVAANTIASAITGVQYASTATVTGLAANISSALTSAGITGVTATASGTGIITISGLGTGATGFAANAFGTGVTVSAVSSGSQTLTFAGVTSNAAALSAATNYSVTNYTFGTAQALNTAGATNSTLTTSGVTLGTTTLNTLVADINANTNAGNTTGISAALTTGSNGQEILTLSGLSAASTLTGANAGTGLTSGNTNTTVGALSNYFSTTQAIASGVSGDTATSLAAKINANSSTTGITAALNTANTVITLSGLGTGTGLAAASLGANATIAAVSGGTQTITFGTSATTLGSAYTATANIATTARTADTTFSVGTAVANGVVSLGGGQNTGLGYGSTTAVGSVLNPVLTAQNQQVASTKIVFPSIQPGDLDSSSYFGSATTITIGTNVGSTDNAATTFTFSANADSASATEIQIGSTLQQTLANAAAKINSFEGNGAQNYVFNQLQATSDGNSITISGKTAQNVYQDDQSTAVTVSASGSSTAVTNATLNNAANGGVDASTINNSAFTGTISGITAAANGTANQVNLSVKIGNITYAANNVSTNPLSNTAVQLVSTDPTGAGGYFTLNLQALNGQNVANQTDANTYAANLNTALSGLSFYQTRQVSSYNPAASGGSIIANGQAIGSLNGSSISATSNDFSKFNFTGISVAAPSGSNANGTITITANGQNYVSSPNIGTSLTANTSYTLTSTSNPNQTITFKTGSNSIDISSPANATAVQNALTSAFGSSGSAISFQVGSTSSQSIGVSIGSASTSALFGGQSLDVKTLNDATNAGNVITTALNTVTALRATVGALEERFTYASNAISSAVQNQGAAQSNLLDTDVSSASTSFSTAQVQLQAGIAVLAQANQLQQQLTKLIQ